MNRDARTEADLTGRGRTLFADPGIWLFVTASFAAACLIFLVQPMVGKRVLPWFGGAPAVWALCLAFYQTVLFAGYTYAHLLSRYLRPTHQTLFHGIALGLAFLSLAKLRLVLADVASCLAFPRTADNVASLIVLSVAGLLEHQIFRKMFAVVAYVQPGYEDILCRHGCIFAASLSADPEHAKLAEILLT